MRSVHRGAIFHLLDDPHKEGDAAVQFLEDGALIIEDGEVASIGAWDDALNGPDVTRHAGLIAPGFIDAHVHYPQLEMIAAPANQLLDWLETYTFPSELRFTDKAVAREAAEAFLAELLRHGTTCAAVYGTVHAASVDALFETALIRNMRIISGKVLMDRQAPAALLDGADLGIAESVALLKRWHGRGRLSYAVTPRFAITSTPAQLTAAGALLAEYPDVYLQTHLAENVAECETVAKLYPDHRDYLQVYEDHGLVRPRSIFAHGVQLSASEFRRLGKAGGALAFCPSSNFFLGSGLFDCGCARAHAVDVALGTDVGAGTSLSLLATMRDAHHVAKLREQTLDAFGAFYMATLGAARALRLDGRIGNLAPGKEADFIVLNPNATPVLARRMAYAKTLQEKLFALMIMGDDRAIAKTYVAGTLAHERGAL